MKQLIKLRYQQFQNLLAGKSRSMQIAAVYQAENTLHVLVKVEKYEVALTRLSVETNADVELAIKFYVVFYRDSKKRFAESNSDCYLQLNSSREFHERMQAMQSVSLYRRVKQPMRFPDRIQLELNVNRFEELYKIPGIPREMLTCLLLYNSALTKIMLCLNKAGIFTMDEEGNLRTLIRLTKILECNFSSFRQEVQDIYQLLSDNNQLTPEIHHVIIKECIESHVIRTGELLELLKLLELADQKSINTLFKCLRGLSAFVALLPDNRKRKEWMCCLLQANPTSQQLYAFYKCWEKSYSSQESDVFFQQLVNNIEKTPRFIKACHALYRWSPDLFAAHHQLVFSGELTYAKIILLQRLNLGACITQILHKNPECIEALEFGFDAYVFYKDAEIGTARHARMCEIARAVVENLHLTNMIIELKQIRDYLQQAKRSPSVYPFEPVPFHRDFLNLVASAKVKPGKNTRFYGSWFTFRQTPTLEQRMETIRKAHHVMLEETSRLQRV